MHEETSYLIMEYLEGQTLADGLRKDPVPLEQLVRYSVGVAPMLSTLRTVAESFTVI